MKTNEKREGIWLSKELMENKDLDWTNKVLLADICSLHELPQGCFGSNEYFGNLLGISSGAASKRISQLTSLGYIKTENKFDKRQCIGRIIIPTNKRYRSKHTENINNEVVPEQPVSTSSDNHGMITEQPNGSSPTTKIVVLDQLGSSSETTKEVLPKQLGGSSSGNTINTSIIKEIEKQLKENEELIEQLPVQYTGQNPEIFNSDSENTETKVPLSKQRIYMNDWFQDYPHWESDLLKLGLKDFISKTQGYHFNEPKYIDLIVEFYNS